MAIRFPCPGCQQPLEVDNEWGGQTVACPYCRRVVTAPAASTWPTNPIPMASPAQPAATGFSPPPPPAGYTVQPPTSARSVAAFVLASVGAGLSLLAFMWFVVMLYSAVIQKVGMTATPAQYQEAMEQMVSKGQIPRPPPLVGMVMIGALCSLAGLVQGVRAMAQREGRKGLALAACIIGAFFLLCPMLWGSALFQ